MLGERCIIVWNNKTNLTVNDEGYNVRLASIGVVDLSPRSSPPPFPPPHQSRWPSPRFHSHIVYVSRKVNNPLLIIQSLFCLPHLQIAQIGSRPRAAHATVSLARHEEGETLTKPPLIVGIRTSGRTGLVLSVHENRRGTPLALAEVHCAPRSSARSE